MTQSRALLVSRLTPAAGASSFGTALLASSSVCVELTNTQERWPVDAAAVVAAVKSVLAAAGPPRCDVHLAIVDDEQIHQINREFLAHDEPTDVISFVLEQDAERLEGELVVSADTAARMAAEIGWPYEHELILYALHGTLHLVGYDDLDPESAQAMRAREAEFLTLLGIDPSVAGRFDS